MYYIHWIPPKKKQQQQQQTNKQKYGEILLWLFWRHID